MLEISIHREGKLVYNSTKIKSINTLAFTPVLLTIPNLGTPENSNVEWIEKQVPVVIEDGDLKTIADFCRSIKSFIDNVIWSLANPFNALYNFLIWIEPMILIICLVVSSAGVLAYILKIDRFLGKSTSQLIKGSVLFYLLFKIVLYSLGVIV